MKLKHLYATGKHNDRLNYAGHIRLWHPTAIFELLDDPDSDWDSPESRWCADDAWKISVAETNEDAVKILDAYLAAEVTK